MLLEVLRKASVKDIPVVRKKIVHVLSTDNPLSAFQKLVDNNIRSAPVFDVKAKKYTGFIDIRDLVAFVVFENKEEALQKLAKSTGCSEFLEALLVNGAKLYDMPLKDVNLVHLSRRHNFSCVNEDASLEAVAKLLVNKGCHRVPVLDGNGKIVNIISQSSIIKYLDEHKAEFEELGSHTVAQMNCGSSPVVAVRTSQTVLDAFKLMAEHDIMGVAVVDECGKFVGNTSASDLKQFLIDPATSLNTPVMEFLSKVRQRNLKAMHPAISVERDDSLAWVIGKLAATHIHRVFVVDNHKLHSVMSLTDILKYAYLVTLIKGV